MGRRSGSASGLGWSWRGSGDPSLDSRCGRRSVPTSLYSSSEVRCAVSTGRRVVDGTGTEGGPLWGDCGGPGRLTVGLRVGPGADGGRWYRWTDSCPRTRVSGGSSAVWSTRGARNRRVDSSSDGSRVVLDGAGGSGRGTWTTGWTGSPEREVEDGTEPGARGVARRCGGGRSCRTSGDGTREECRHCRGGTEGGPAPEGLGSSGGPGGRDGPCGPSSESTPSEGRRSSLLGVPPG